LFLARGGGGSGVGGVGGGGGGDARTRRGDATCDPMRGTGSSLSLITSERPPLVARGDLPLIASRENHGAPLFPPCVSV